MPFNEPNQLTIENFLEFLNSHSQDLLPTEENSEEDRHRANEAEERDEAEVTNDCVGSSQHGKDEASFENWSVFNCKVLMDRKETSNYAQKTGKKYIKLSNSSISPLIQEYEEDAPPVEKQDKFLKEMIKAQRNNIIDFNSKHPFSVSLFKRLSILETVFSFLSKKYHLLKVAKSSSKMKPKEAKSERGFQNQMPQGTDVMVQLGVKTGLTLLFSLMKQAWIQSSQSSALCSDVLSTVESIVISLPPLSLANSAKLPKLAINSLDQVMDFLRDVVKGKVTVDTSDRRLCAEILIGLALQRGSLLAILDWIETGFKSILSSDQMSVGKTTMSYWVKQMQSINFSEVVQLLLLTL